MDISNQEGEGKKKITEVKPFQVSLPLKGNQENNIINTNKTS